MKTYESLLSEQPDIPEHLHMYYVRWVWMFLNRFDADLQGDDRPPAHLTPGQPGRVTPDPLRPFGHPDAT